MLTIYYEAPPFEVLFPDENKTIIRIKKEDNQNDILVSRFGYVYLVTDYDDSELHIFKTEKVFQNGKFLKNFLKKCLLVQSILFNFAGKIAT
jgi:hypothetical protein